MGCQEMTLGGHLYHKPQKCHRSVPNWSNPTTPKKTSLNLSASLGTTCGYQRMRCRLNLCDAAGAPVEVDSWKAASDLYADMAEHHITRSFQ